MAMLQGCCQAAVGAGARLPRPSGRHLQQGSWGAGGALPGARGERKGGRICSLLRPAAAGEALQLRSCAWG